MAKVTAFTISRKEWLRGEGNASCLLRSWDDKRCCVGIYARALGVPDEKLKDVAWPDRYSTKSAWDGKEAPWLVVDGCEGDEELATVNDTTAGGYGQVSSEADRERLIADIFDNHGVTVTFVD